MKKEVLSLRSLYNDAMGRVKALETALLNAETMNDSLTRKFNDYDNLIEEYNAAVSSRGDSRGGGKYSGTWV